jgi:hypothetical protein
MAAGDRSVDGFERVLSAGSRSRVARRRDGDRLPFQGGDEVAA